MTTPMLHFINQFLLVFGVVKKNYKINFSFENIFWFIQYINML